MPEPTDRYAARGVSADKAEVHAAVEALDEGLFPNAFCRVLPDPHSTADAIILHTDTAGSKAALAWMYWKETGDFSVWEGLVQDALVMNLDDMACAGATDHFIISSNIARNKGLVPGEVLQALISGTQAFCEFLDERFEITAMLAGGETADVGDLVRTLDVGYTVFSRQSRANILPIGLKPGLDIVGFASFGQAKYETAYNSGIGSNGLTSARHDLLHPDYRERYPQTYDPALAKELVYTGPWHLTDEIETSEGQTTTFGKFLLSPTRLFTPLIGEMLSHHSRQIAGLIHCTGGGQTKCLKFAGEDLIIVKDNLPPSPKVFQLIQESSGTPLREMYRTFNMGVRLEAYCEPSLTEELIHLAESFGIPAWRIGETRSGTGPAQLQIGEENYSA